MPLIRLALVVVMAIGPIPPITVAPVGPGTIGIGGWQPGQDPNAAPGTGPIGAPGTGAAPGPPPLPLLGPGPWPCVSAVVPNPCAPPPAAPATPPVVDAGTVARSFWRQFPLPRPRGLIQPGEALTGKRAYLQISGPQTGSWTATVFGTVVTITATSTYDVDWGDGTWDTNLTDQGGPWPDGDITHVYQFAGTATVVVHQHWTAAYTATGPAPGTGTLAGLETVSDPIVLPVKQVQAVILS